MVSDRSEQTELSMLRDHDVSCEHDGYASDQDGYWECDWYGCPGGMAVLASKEAATEPDYKAAADHEQT